MLKNQGSDIKNAMYKLKTIAGKNESEELPMGQPR
jgi:hypothetical protein